MIPRSVTVNSTPTIDNNVLAARMASTVTSCTDVSEATELFEPQVRTIYFVKKCMHMILPVFMLHGSFV